MRHCERVFAALFILGLSSCSGTMTAADFDCEKGLRMGELNVVLGPTPDPFGLGETVLVGDSLALTAEVRPVVGGTFDFLGSGGCRTDYGAPIPATFNWSSADTTLATVSSTGVVRGKKVGETTVTAHAPTRGLSASRAIEVFIRRP